MDLKRVLAVVAIIGASVGCGHGKSGATQPESAVPPTMQLWRLAPADSVAGVVIADGGLRTVREWATEFLRIADARPETKDLSEAVRRELKNAPFDPLNDAALVSAGIDIEKGVAVFASAKEEISVVMPVADRKAFAALFGAVTQREAGGDIESFEGGALRCKALDSHYVCSTSLERLSMVGVAPGNRLAEAAGALAAPLQGDAQVLVDLANSTLAARIRGLDRYVSNPGMAVVSGRMEQGKLSLRAHLPGALVGDGQKLAAAPSSLAGKVGAERPSGFFRARLSPSMVPITGGSLVPGVSTSDIIESLTGELIAFTHAGTVGSSAIQIGLTKPDTFRQLLQMGCGAVSSFVPFLSVKSAGSACRGSLDFKGLPGGAQRALLQSKADIAIDVQPDRIDARASLLAAGPITNAPGPSALGANLLSGEWNLSLWAEALSPIYAFDIIDQSIFRGMSEKQLKAALWLAGHLYEAGIGVGFRADGIHGLFEMTSFAAASGADYAGYEAALGRLVDGDGAAAKLALEALGKNAGAGIVARQIAMRGSAWLGALVGTAGVMFAGEPSTAPAVSKAR